MKLSPYRLALALLSVVDTLLDGMSDADARLVAESLSDRYGRVVSRLAGVTR